MEGLLQGMLTTHCGVRHLIGVDDPAGAGREIDIALIGAGLIAEVGFHPIMQSEHEMIVIAAQPLGDAHCLQDLIGAG